jgi:hypothetical protein
MILNIQDEHEDPKMENVYKTIDRRSNVKFLEIVLVFQSKNELFPFIVSVHLLQTHFRMICRQFQDYLPGRYVKPNFTKTRQKRSLFTGI